MSQETVISKIWFSPDGDIYTISGDIYTMFQGCADATCVRLICDLSDREWFVEIGMDAEAYDAIGQWLTKQ